jgi:hypothetical protein
MQAFQPGSNSKRWWVVLAWTIIDVAVHNAFIIYCHLPSAKQLTNREFRLQLAEELVHDFLSRKQTARSAAEPGAGCQLVNLTTKRRCRECGLKSTGGDRSETVYGCTTLHNVSKKNGQMS